MSKFLKGVKVFEGGEEQNGYFIPCLVGEGEPTTETEGAVGSLYMNQITGDIYKCISSSEGWAWVLISNNNTLVPLVQDSKGSTYVTLDYIPENGTEISFLMPKYHFDEFRIAHPGNNYDLTEEPFCIVDYEGDLLLAPSYEQGYIIKVVLNVETKKAYFLGFFDTNKAIETAIEASYNQLTYWDESHGVTAHLENIIDDPLNPHNITSEKIGALSIEDFEKATNEIKQEIKQEIGDKKQAFDNLLGPISDELLEIFESAINSDGEMVQYPEGCNVYTTQIERADLFSNSIILNTYCHNLTGYKISYMFNGELTGKEYVKVREGEDIAVNPEAGIWTSTFPLDVEDQNWDSIYVEISFVENEDFTKLTISNGAENLWEGLAYSLQKSSSLDEFGLGNFTVIDASDCNQLVKNGWYSTTPNALNRPIWGNDDECECVILVISNGDFILQIGAMYLQDNRAIPRIRQCQNGKWTNWTDIITTDNADGLILLDLFDHLDNTDNPHNVTCEQIRAIPEDVYAEHLWNLTQGIDAANEAHIIHLEDHKNPHEVTCTQIGAVTQDDLRIETQSLKQSTSYQVNFDLKRQNSTKLRTSAFPKASGIYDISVVGDVYKVAFENSETGTNLAGWFTDRDLWKVESTDSLGLWIQRVDGEDILNTDFESIKSSIIVRFRAESLIRSVKSVEENVSLVHSEITEKEYQISGIEFADLYYEGRTNKYWDLTKIKCNIPNGTGKLTIKNSHADMYAFTIQWHSVEDDNNIGWISDDEVTINLNGKDRPFLRVKRIDGAKIAEDEIDIIRKGLSLIYHPMSKYGYVSPTGSDDNIGTSDKPYATVSKAIADGCRDILLYGGIYEQTIQLPESGTIKIAPAVATEIPVFVDPNRLKITGAEIHTGNVYVVDTSFRVLVDTPMIFQDDIPGVTTLITDAERMPQQRGKEYRCSDTMIRKCTAITLSDAITEMQEAESYKFFYDSTNNKLYFTSPNTDFVTHPIVCSSDGKLFEGISKSVTLHVSGIECKYMRFDISNTVNSIISNCKCSGAYANALGQFVYDDALNAHFINCEACMSHGASNGDGFNSHSTNSGDTFAHQSGVVLENCWSHDNMDDGWSDHSRGETTIIGGLYEYNGKGGITPSYGTHCVCHDVYSRYNYNGFNYVANANDGGQGGQLICYNCVAEENTRGSSADGYGFVTKGEDSSLTLVSCKSIKNRVGYGNTKPTGKIKLIDCCDIENDIPFGSLGQIENIDTNIHNNVKTLVDRCELTSATGGELIYKYPIVAGRKYKITNNSTDYINVRTRDSAAQTLETWQLPSTTGSVKTFTANYDAVDIRNVVWRHWLDCN